MLAALLNGLIWLTPLPIHLIALFMPFFSGYSIAAGRQAKGPWPSLEIGFVMGLTLGSAIMAIGLLAIIVISLLASEVQRFTLWWLSLLRWPSAAILPLLLLEPS